MISVLPPQSPTQLPSLSAHVGPGPGPPIWCGCCSSTVDTAALSWSPRWSPWWWSLIAHSGTLVSPGHYCRSFCNYCKHFSHFFTFCPFSSCVKCVGRHSPPLSQKDRPWCLSRPVQCQPAVTWIQEESCKVQVTNIILICFWLLRSNFESSQYSRYLALGNSRVTAAAGLRLYTHPVQITLLNTYIVLIDLLKFKFHWKSIELLEYLHRRIVTRSCLYNFQMELGVILILFLTLAARTRCIYHIAATISPPLHCRQCCLSRHFAHHHLFISHYFRCDQFSPPRHVSGGLVAWLTMDCTNFIELKLDIT